MRFFVLAIAIAGCGETGLERVTFPIHAAGSEEISFDDDGWIVTIERADVAFGPIYLCATSFADVDVCPRAEAEWLGAATIDALHESPVMIGEADAVTATVRSAMFDYGRSWLLTEERPQPSDAAPEGRSAIFDVVADDGMNVIEIHAEIDVDPGDAGQSAVIGAPAGPHTITGDERLVVVLDPIEWWRRVDFDRVALAAEDGAVTLERGDPDYEALVIAMTAGRLPALAWDTP